MVCFHGRSIVPRPYNVRLLLKLPSAQSPFARARCYLSRHGVWHHVSGFYPTFIAPTGSCASPPPSSCLGRTLNTRSRQVAVSPCWEEDLPDVISAHPSLRAWTPLDAQPCRLLAERCASGAAGSGSKERADAVSRHRKAQRSARSLISPT